MSNSELHLFIFEGVRAESKYADSLEQNFLGKKISVKCVYDAEIYHQVGDMIPEVRSSLDRSGHVIVTDETVEAAIERADRIVDGVVFIVDRL